MEQPLRCCLPLYEIFFSRPIKPQQPSSSCWPWARRRSPKSRGCGGETNHRRTTPRRRLALLHHRRATSSLTLESNDECSNSFEESPSSQSACGHHTRHQQLWPCGYFGAKPPALKLHHHHRHHLDLGPWLVSLSLLMDLEVGPHLSRVLRWALTRDEVITLNYYYHHVYGHGQRQGRMLSPDDHQRRAAAAYMAALITRGTYGTPSRQRATRRRLRHGGGNRRLEAGPLCLAFKERAYHRRVAKQPTLPGPLVIQRPHLLDLRPWLHSLVLAVDLEVAPHLTRVYQWALTRGEVDTLHYYHHSNGHHQGADSPPDIGKVASTAPITATDNPVFVLDLDLPLYWTENIIFNDEDLGSFLREYPITKENFSILLNYINRSKALPPSDGSNRLLGQGGFGKVYKVDDLAVKVMQIDLTLGEQANYDIVCLWREFRLVHNLADHPAILKPLDMAVHGDTFYISMPVCHTNLSQALYHAPYPSPLSNEDIIALIGRVCSALHAMTVERTEVGLKGLVHRDIKAENLMLQWGVDEKGEPCLAIKLVDFGLVATYTETAAPTLRGRCGTDYHMAPEVLEDDSLYDHRIDLFSLGSTIFFALCFRNADITVLNTHYEGAGGMLEARMEILDGIGTLEPPVRFLLKCLLSEEPAGRTWRHVEASLYFCLKLVLGLEVPMPFQVWGLLDSLPFSEQFKEEVSSVAPFM